VAIVEDKVKSELNPNVAMEWGFMKAMGKPVLYLEEESFKERRADWSGLIRDPFAWDDPMPGIEKAITNWLKQK
jgi:nucleoside 2-deoxyribosyltransferase